MVLMLILVIHPNGLIPMVTHTEIIHPLQHQAMVVRLFQEHPVLIDMGVRTLMVMVGLILMVYGLLLTERTPSSMSQHNGLIAMVTAMEIIR